MPIDYCLTATPLTAEVTGYTIEVAFLLIKLKKKLVNLNPLDIKNYQRSLWFGFGSTFCRESKQD